MIRSVGSLLCQNHVLKEIHVFRNPCPVTFGTQAFHITNQVNQKDTTECRLGSDSIYQNQSEVPRSKSFLSARALLKSGEKG